MSRRERVQPSGLANGDAALKGGIGKSHRIWALLHTIRVRLTLWYVALLAAILIAFSGFLYVSLAHELHAEVDRLLAVEAQQIAEALDMVEGRPQLREGPTYLPAGLAVALYDPTGQALLARNLRQPIPISAVALARAAGGEPIAGTTRLPDGSEWRAFATPVLENGRVVGVLQIARPERDIATSLGQLVGLMAIAIPLTLLLAVVGGLFLAGRALGPIDRIARTAAQIGAEDLSRRLGLPPGVDEVGRLAATFDQMLDRLERAFRRQRQFTADASHELRTPLTMLMSQADVALERCRTASEYRQVLASIREDATRMSQLLGELLTLARADAGQEKLVLEPLSLAELADDVVAAMGPLAQTRGVRLRRGGEEFVVAEGDQTRLTQLLVNLVDNGLKYTSAGGTVAVSVEREGGQAVLRVADTGAGIAPEHLPHLFERFYRVDKARSRAEGGAGLGLAICKWIVDAHRGEIGVTSEPGRGTTFTVRLPLVATSPPVRAPASRRALPGGSTSARRATPSA